MVQSIFEQPTLTLPFHLRGQEGTVAIYYGVNHHPLAWRLDLLDLPFDLSLIEGFPVCQATLTYPGAGYQAVMGWIQLITVQETKTGKVWVSNDQWPNQQGSSIPFLSFGYLPTLFDAPGPNPPRTDEIWLAETFLVSCPDVGRSPTIRPVLGFRWGYTLVEMKPVLLPVEPLASSRWQAHLSFLREHYPSWEFLSSPAEEET